jgi:hypothetical protein
MIEIFVCSSNITKFSFKAEFALGITVKSPEPEEANFLGQKKRPKEALLCP